MGEGHVKVMALLALPDRGILNISRPFEDHFFSLISSQLGI